jgi:hypothetical protein
MRSLLLIPLFVALATGCAPRDAELRLARLEAEHRSLEATFDRLEDRLLVNQARVRLWRELKERHESVSAVACASLDQHAEEMARRVLPGAAAAGSIRVANASATESHGEGADSSRGAPQ